jgi:LPS sulfotransferase NodH
MTIKLSKKVKARIKHRLIEAKNYFYNSVKSTTPDNVRLLIFGQGRTGSSLLESLICSTGYFFRNGELLNTDKGEILYPVQYIRGLTKRKASENIIFHIKVYQLTKDRRRPFDPADFLNTLYNDGWKIIYLRRKNKVRHALSNVVAEHRGHFHKFNDKEEKYSLSIDCNKFIDRVNERFKFEDAERSALANIHYHEIIYEDDLEKSDTHQATINRILDYISLEHREIGTKHRKVNTQSLKDLIVNYDEFMNCLTAHNLRKFL